MVIIQSAGVFACEPDDNLSYGAVSASFLLFQRDIFENANDSASSWLQVA